MNLMRLYLTINYTLLNDELFICGDFNIHVNKAETLKTFDLVQDITEPTHLIFGNILRAFTE